MRRFLLGGACAVLLAAPAWAGEAMVDGHKVAYREWGSGERTLVMLSGLGDGGETFAKVGPDLAKAGYRVIAYDRAGYGGSPVVPGRHDAVRAEGELKGLLAALAIRRPVVLLGHSVGGIYAAYFAAKNPSLVSGLVLEETRPTGFTAACKVQLKFGCEIPGLLKLAMPGAGRQEADDIALSEQEEQDAGGGPTPTLILTRKNAGQGGFDGVWLAQQAKLPARWPHSTLKAAPKGGHYVHQDARDWFVEQVSAFIAPLP